MRTLKHILAAVSVLGISIAFVGCDSNESGQTDSVLGFDELPDAGEEDQQAAQTSAAAAKAEVERVLSEAREADQTDLEQIDFRETDRLYREAIAADPKNTEAQLRIGPLLLAVAGPSPSRAHPAARAEGPVRLVQGCPG